MKLLWTLFVAFFLSGCTGLPEDIEPVNGFELERYLGRWYEIARLDHRFERGLEEVTATYTMLEDGNVRVTNRGYSTRSGKWKDADGRARLSGDPSVGRLEVSFFRPFYGPYVIFELDKVNYEYAFVTGSKKSLWLLSRSSEIGAELKRKFLESVRQLGYDVDALVFVQHGAMPPP